MAAILAATAVVDIDRAGALLAPSAGSGLTAAAFDGAPVRIRLFPESCTIFDFGAIICGSDYAARYQPGANSWMITGPARGTAGAVTNTASNAEPVPGSLSLWGVLFTFDRDGTLVYSGQAVGKISPRPVSGNLASAG